jgi:hypothetical protein
MKTIYTTTYWECEKSISDLSNALIGPAIFSERHSAISCVFNYVKTRMIDAYPDMMDEYIESNERFDGCDIDEALLEIAQSTDEQEKLLEYYFGFAQDDLMLAGYSIEEHPIMSFSEAIEQADCVTVNGLFMRNFTRYTDNASADDDVIFDADDVDSEIKSYHYLITNQEAANAFYDLDKKSWRCAGNDYQFSKQSTLGLM